MEKLTWEKDRNVLDILRILLIITSLEDKTIRPSSTSDNFTVKLLAILTYIKRSQTYLIQGIFLMILQVKEQAVMEGNLGTEMSFLQWI